MEDKEKQIEEMEQYLVQSIVCSKSWKPRDIIEHLTKMIIPENSIVLPKSEYNDLKEFADKYIENLSNDKYLGTDSVVNTKLFDEFIKNLLDAFPEGNRDNHCPAIYYDDYKYIIEELAEKTKNNLKDSVVISRKEYEKNIRYCKSIEDLSEKLNNLNLYLGIENQKLKEELENKSKEMAEKIINDILEFLKVCPNIITSSYTTYYEKVPLREYLIELAKQIGVEIKE